MTFIHDDFLLSNDTAAALYHDYAKTQPIYDYHCHLPPADLAGNRKFGNLYEAWLEGDHYKWRAMRANGVNERFCTGDAEPYEKFKAFAATVPHTLRNPLYHWTHLELKRYFDIDLLLNQDTAREVWDHANAKLADLPVAQILDRFDVALIGTTDQPTDDLNHHRQLSENNLLPRTTVVPSFRPDKLHDLTDPAAWNRTVDQLAHVTGVRIAGFEDFLQAVTARHRYFHDHGARVSDHGLTALPAAECSEDLARTIFDRARGRDRDARPEDLVLHDGPRRNDADRFTSYMMLFLAELDHAADWTHQLHLGAMRNNNAWAMEHLGPDTGYDSIGDYRQAPGLRRHLGTLAGREKLPRTILYNLNPADNYLFAAMIGNYQDGATPGKLQFGSGWWFLDQKQAMTWQLDALSNLGLLTRFVGMLTDSRSFLSYPRHEYFRRVLCDLLGRDVAAGELPDDREMLGRVVEDICFHNAHRYFGIELKR